MCLFWIFCVYQDTPRYISISLNKKLDYSVPIIFVPRGINKQTAPAAIKPTTAVKTEVRKLVQKKAPTVMVAPKVATPIVAEIKKPEIKPASSSAKALADKPIKKEVAKVEPEKKIPVPAKQEVAKIEPPTPVIKPGPIKKETVKAPESSPIAPPLAAIIPNNAIVSDNYREVEALRRHAQLQNEIVKCWKPPFGISPECACDISFFVSDAGKLHDIKVTKGSGVVMYDISARQALYAMNMPKWTYGKQIIINFKQ